MKVDPKVVAEVVPIVFDFTNVIGTNLISDVAEVGVTVVSNPGNATVTSGSLTAMLVGVPVITGPKVVQLIGGGIAGVIYRYHCIIDVGGERYQIDGSQLVKQWYTGG